jgi:spore coat protein U-like protein
MTMRIEAIAVWALSAAFVTTPHRAAAQDMLVDTAASGPCQLELQIDNDIEWRGPYGRGYEVFEPGDAFEPVAVSIRHQGAPCRYFLTASMVGAGNQGTLEGPGSGLQFDVRREPQGPSLLSPDITGNALTRLAGQFRGGVGGASLPVYVDVPSGQLAAGGTYRGQVAIRLFRDDEAGPELADEATLGITVPVPSVLKVEADDAPPGTRNLAVDLGELTQGADRLLQFSLRSNAPVSVRFDSRNHGTLAHNFGGPAIPYQLAVNGQAVNLSGTGALHPLTNGPRNGLSVPLAIIVNAQPGAAAGDYSDVLTVTFRAD